MCIQEGTPQRIKAVFNFNLCKTIISGPSTHRQGLGPFTWDPGCGSHRWDPGLETFTWEPAPISETWDRGALPKILYLAPYMWDLILQINTWNQRKTIFFLPEYGVFCIVLFLIFNL